MQGHQNKNKEHCMTLGFRCAIYLKEFRATSNKALVIETDNVLTNLSTCK